MCWILNAYIKTYFGLQCVWSISWCQDDIGLLAVADCNPLACNTTNFASFAFHSNFPGNFCPGMCCTLFHLKLGLGLQDDISIFCGSSISVCTSWILLHWVSLRNVVLVLRPTKQGRASAMSQTNWSTSLSWIEKVICTFPISLVIIFWTVTIHTFVVT